MSRERRVLFYGIPLVFIVLYMYPYVPALVRLPCTIRFMLGFDCPGCGMTRSLAMLAHGQIMRSIDFNPMGPVLFLIGCYVWLRLFYIKVTGRSDEAIASRAGSKFIGTAFLAGLMLQWFIHIGIYMLY